MLIENLSKFNNWWIDGRVKEGLLRESKRDLFFSLEKYVKNKQALMIIGLRQVGKTTILYQLIQKLLDEKTNSKNILYFSFDETKADLNDVLETYRKEVLKKDFDLEKVYLFLDEIQKCEDWQNKIKIYYDLYPKIKIFLSGSAAVILQKKSKESLAGRIFEFHLKPLSFAEFLKIKQIPFKDNELELFKERLITQFNNYLMRAFPEIVLEEDEEKIKKYLKNTLIEKIIFKDLPEEFGIKDTELLQKIMELFSSNPGMTLNIEKLSKDFAKNKLTISNYISYLKHSLIIKTVSNYRENFLSSSRKLKKIYLSEPSISIAYSTDFQKSEFIGKIIENVIAKEIDAEHYYRKLSQEIDFIIKIGKKVLPVEVKYRENEINSKKFAYIARKLKLTEGIIISKETEKTETINKIKIKIIPAWKFLLLKKQYIQ